MLTSKEFPALSEPPVLFCALKVLTLLMCAKMPLSSTPVNTVAGMGILLSKVQVMRLPEPVFHEDDGVIVHVERTNTPIFLHLTVTVPLFVVYVTTVGAGLNASASFVSIFLTLSTPPPPFGRGG